MNTIERLTNNFINNQNNSMEQNLELQQMKAALPALSPAIMENIVVSGDLSGLSKEQLVLYYQHYCLSLGLNPATKPFIVIAMKGDAPNTTKKVLYAGREATAQLNKLYSVSHETLKRWIDNGCAFTEVRASTPDGRSTVSLGIVPVTQYVSAAEPMKPLYGETYANAIKKSETQAKRRSTLDLCGLGMLDAETEGIGYENTPYEITKEPIPISNNISISAEPLPKKRTKKELTAARQAMRDTMQGIMTIEELDKLQQSDFELFEGNAEMLEFYANRRKEFKSAGTFTEAVDVTDIVTPPVDDLDTPLPAVKPDQDIYDSIANVKTEQERLIYMNSMHPVHNKKVVDYVKEKGGELLEYAKQRRAELNTQPIALVQQAAAVQPTTRQL